MKPTKKVLEALDAVGAKLKRAKRHKVFELPNGRNVVIPSTPSDSRRGEQNALCDIRKAAGIVPEPKPEKPVRERRRKPGRDEPPRLGLPRESDPMALAFRKTGLVEQQLRSRIGELESALATRDALIVRLEGLWFVRLWRWFGGAT